MKSILLKLISWVVAIIGIVAFVIGPNDGIDKNKDLMVDYALIVLAVTAIVAIGFSLINIVKRPKVLKGVLISLAILGVILLIAYLTAGNGPVYNSAGELKLNAGSTSKWVSTGITYSIILLTLGSLLFLYDMIKNIVK